MKIYTRTGDQGSAGTLANTRQPKSAAIFAALGDLDELSAVLGLAAGYADHEFRAEIERVQSDLLSVGAELAAESGDERFRSSIGPERIAALEAQIDAWTEAMPALAQFVLPGGSSGGATLHLARTVCRRAERHVVFFAEQTPVRNDILGYLNRLSDWLFTAARTENHRSGNPEPHWTP